MKDTQAGCWGGPCVQRLSSPVPLQAAPPVAGSGLGQESETLVFVLALRGARGHSPVCLAVDLGQTPA